MKETEFMRMLGPGKVIFVNRPANKIVAKLTANGRRVLTSTTDDGKKLMKFTSEELYNKYKTGKTIRMSKKSTKKSVKKLMKKLTSRKSNKKSRKSKKMGGG